MATPKSTYKIVFEVGLDEKGIPEKIIWNADDNPAGEGRKPAKAILLSLFDRDSKETFKIDLWTKEMQVIEMDRFMFQTMRAMADTYFKATGNKALATQMQQFVDHFGKETEILPKE
jgi:gliding motility-associated protein GldC